MASVLFHERPHPGRLRRRALCRRSLLLVDGDPVADITVLQKQERILAVMKDGAFHREPERVSGRARWSLPAA